MNASIISPVSSLLKPYVEYFLFLKNEEGKGFYRTFPNTNVCLAIYRQNKVDWDISTNHCRVDVSSETGKSKLFAYHRKPFSVSYKGPVDQVCILFRLEGLAAFTNLPLNEIDRHDDPLRQLFGREAGEMIARLFSLTNEKDQARLLESFLLRKLAEPQQRYKKFTEALHLFRRSQQDEGKIIRTISSRLMLHPSTLYRNFCSYFGQAPHEIYKTMRFRRALTRLLSGQDSLTEIAYDCSYYDQSHFIRDIRQFTGESPYRLQQQVTEVDGRMLWLKK